MLAAQELSRIDLMYLADDYCFVPGAEYVDRSLTFAEGKSPDNPYIAKFRNAPLEKMFLQDAYSKLAEFGASIFLKEIFNEDYEVDTKIYPPWKKSWAADLGKHIGVKSTPLLNPVAENTSGKHNASWLFNGSNNDGIGGRDKGIFGLSAEEKKIKKFVFVVVEEEEIKPTTKIWIKGIWTAHDLEEYDVHDLPIFKKYYGIKSAVYDGRMKEIQAKLRKNLDYKI